MEDYYLLLSVRALSANPNFCFAEVTAPASEPLIGWAKFVDERLQAGERPFLRAPPVQAPVDRAVSTSFAHSR